MFYAVWWFLLLVGVGCVSSTFCVYLFLTRKNFKRVFLITFINLALFLPIPNETDFLVKNDRWSVVDLFVIMLLAQFLQKLLLLKASNIFTTMSLDGADSMSFLKNWPHLFYWSIDVSFLVVFSRDFFFLSFYIHCFFHVKRLWCTFSTIHFSLTILLSFHSHVWL